MNDTTYSKPADAELRRRLSPLEYEVTQKAATEPPFRNHFWDNHEPGLYVDIVSGEPLFSSADKFDSGTGWPSFTRPVEADRVVALPDNNHAMTRTEVIWLGHTCDLGSDRSDEIPSGSRWPGRERGQVCAGMGGVGPIERPGAP